MSRIKSESRFTFMEATSVIVGHGVGAGILSVPFLAHLNRWYDILWIIAVAYTINLLMHYMVADLSYNNGGAQFIKCLERELFVGRFKKVISYACFTLLTVSVVLNVSGYITGASAVLTTWLGLSGWLATILYYVFAASVVYFGMKIVGICQEIAVMAMLAVIGVILVATLSGQWHELPTQLLENKYLLALYSIVAFSLSAVMSVPQVVKGLDGDTKKIRASIATGNLINASFILIITFMTMLGAGTGISQNGALVDLSVSLGGWFAIIGYIFSLLALTTSFWANTLNLRDVVSEQFKFNLKLSWFIASAPCLVIALIGTETFVGFIRLASAIQIVTGIGVIIAFNRSRKKHDKNCKITGTFGSLPWQILVVASAVVATVGSLITISH